LWPSLPEIPLQHLLQHVIEPQNTVVLVFTCCTKSYSTKSLQNKSKKNKYIPQHHPSACSTFFHIDIWSAISSRWRSFGFPNVSSSHQYPAMA
jgi:hypothetical protein